MSEAFSVPADFGPGSANAAILQERLRPKLLEAGYAQEELLGNFCEFITIMIGNAKTKDQINSELSELIGDDFDPSFTDWLFSEVDKIARGTIYSNHEMQDYSMEDAPINEPPTIEVPRRFRLGAPTGGRSAPSPYPQPSRVFDQINRVLQRPDPAQIKHHIPDLPNVPTGPRSQSSAGPIRRNGRQGGRAPLVAQTPPNFGAFMVANGMPHELFQQMMAEAANFQNQMFHVQGGNLATRISDPMEGSSGIVVAGGDRNRCRHWPRCQLGSRCKFHHPSQICPDYPNCPYLAGTCPNIHVGEDVPESELHNIVSQQSGNGKAVNGHNKFIPRPNGQPARQENQPPKPKTNKPQEQVPLCKFGTGCAKHDCSFAHPTPAAGQEGLVLRGETCPDGRGCQNRDCDMGHPSPAVEGVKRKETEPCKFFPNCTNPECPYKHPAVSVAKALSIPCKYGVNCTRPNCIFNHEIAIPCRYHPCLNEHCLFQHTEGQQPNKNKVWTPGTNGSSMMERKFAYESAEERITVGGGTDGSDDTVVHE